MDNRSGGPRNNVVHRFIAWIEIVEGWSAKAVRLSNEAGRGQSCNRLFFEMLVGKRDIFDIPGREYRILGVPILKRNDVKSCPPAPNKEGMMETYVDIAIQALRDYLIYLLRAGRWCDARRVGGALEAVLSTQQTIKEREAGQAMQEAPRNKLY